MYSSTWAFGTPITGRGHWSHTRRTSAGEQVTDPQTGQFGQPEPRVEEQRDDQPIAGRGDSEESLELDRSERPTSPNKSTKTC
jgi:hypothetical protein